MIRMGPPNPTAPRRQAFKAAVSPPQSTEFGSCQNERHPFAIEQYIYIYIPDYINQLSPTSAQAHHVASPMPAWGSIKQASAWRHEQSYLFDSLKG